MASHIGDRWRTRLEGKGSAGWRWFDDGGGQPEKV